MVVVVEHVMRLPLLSRFLISLVLIPSKNNYKAKL